MTATPDSPEKLQARAKALVAKQPTATLLTSLVLVNEQINASDKRNTALIYTRVWTFDELAKRFPAANEKVDDLFMTQELTYEATGEYPAEQIDQFDKLVMFIRAELAAKRKR